MMKTKLIWILLFLVLPIISSSIVDGNCSSGETCMFSIYSLEDSHLAECGYYNYSICYPEQINVTLEYSEDVNPTCLVGNCILSQFKQNNSHVGVCNYYNYSLCIQGTTCEMGITCYREHKLVTFNMFNNSHSGEYGYYSIGLCCGNIVKGISGTEPSITPPVIEIPEIIVEVIEVVKKIPVYAWVLMFGLFFFRWKRRKKRCYECRRKFKKKTLTLYNYKRYCKECFKKVENMNLSLPHFHNNYT